MPPGPLFFCLRRGFPAPTGRDFDLRRGALLEHNGDRLSLSLLDFFRGI